MEFVKWNWSNNGHSSNFFFSAIQTRKMSFTIFQNKKTPFQAEKTRSSKSRKIDIFPWNCSMELLQKWQFFTLFFRQYSIGKCLIRYSRTTKTPFQAIKTGSSKTRENVIFETFLTSSFYSLERCFFALEYRKRHFPGLYCLKKKVGKMAIFGPKLWVNPSRKKVNVQTF